MRARSRFAETRSRLAEVFAARDPARSRLTNAVAVAAGVLVGAVLANSLLTQMHADKALLSLCIFLSLQAGNMVKDHSASGRAITTAVLIPSSIAAMAVGMLLNAHRPVAIAVFVLITGGAIWVRRFGPRAAAIGALAMISYFFVLFMKPTMSEVPVFALMAVCSIGSQLLVRLVLLLQRPRRQIIVLLRELRSASALAIRAASRATGEGDLRSVLARMDDVGLAIASWQSRHPTARHIACDESTLTLRVLDARGDTDEACYAVARGAMRDESPSPELSVALAQLLGVLDENAREPRLGAAERWADEVLARTARDDDDDAAVRLVAKSARAHLRVRAIDLSRGVSDTGARAVEAPSHTAAPAARPAQPTSGAAPFPPKPAGGERGRRARLKHWAPTDRMAVQVMVAALLASVVGEAISASRWYWAVMTAFVIFIGATTRGGILTRAFRRLVGTVIGVVIGASLVALMGDSTGVLIVICVVAVFGMLYLGPLNYLYSAACLTTLLVVIYRMLGVLDDRLLELRLEETLFGAVIGVLCAYLIVSANSQPAIVTKLEAYFDALDEVLRAAATGFREGRDADGIHASLRALESAQDDVDQILSSMAAAFMVSGSRREADAVHLMHVVTRSAAQLTQAVADADADAVARPERSNSPTSQVLVEIDAVGATVADARRTLCGPVGAPPSAPAHGVATGGQVAVADSPESTALRSLERIDWVLRRIVDHGDTAQGAAHEAPPRESPHVRRPT